MNIGFLSPPTLHEGSEEVQCGGGGGRYTIKNVKIEIMRLGRFQQEQYKNNKTWKIK